MHQLEQDWLRTAVRRLANIIIYNGQSEHQHVANPVLIGALRSLRRVQSEHQHVANPVLIGALRSFVFRYVRQPDVIGHPLINVH